MIPPRRRPTAALLLLGACALALVSLLSPTPAGAQQRRVVVVGDSIILGAQGPLTSAFTNQGWAVTYDSAVSRSTSSGLGAVEAHRAELTDSLVVSLGANDAGNPSTFRQRVQAILDATATVPHVYWVTIREVRDYYGPANQIVRELAAGRPNVTVVDWHAATAGATDLTSSDGLHLNGAGAAKMAQVVADAVVSGALPTAAAAPTTLPPTTTAPPPTTVAPPTTAAATTVAPTTTAAPTTAAPTTTVERDRRNPDVDDAAASSILDVDTIWTVGGGFGVVVLVMAVCGVALAGWSLLRSRPGAAVPRSPAHPAVRARQRAERIAAASADLPDPSTPAAAADDHVVVDTQQS